MDGVGDRGNRISIELGRASNKRIQQLGHAVFRHDIINELHQPQAERFNRWMRFRQAPGRSGKLRRLVAIDGGNQRIARRKVAIKRSDANAGCAGNFLQTGAGTLAGKHGLCGFHQQKTIAFGIRTRLSDGGPVTFSGHFREVPLINGGALRIYLEASSFYSIRGRWAMVHQPGAVRPLI